jgi:Protein of unknown function TPD sequence-motif
MSSNGAERTFRKRRVGRTTESLQMVGRPTKPTTQHITMVLPRWPRCPSIPPALFHGGPCLLRRNTPHLNYYHFKVVPTWRRGLFSAGRVSTTATTATEIRRKVPRPAKQQKQQHDKAKSTTATKHLNAYHNQTYKTVTKTNVRVFYPLHPIDHPMHLLMWPSGLDYVPTQDEHGMAMNVATQRDKLVEQHEIQAAAKLFEVCISEFLNGHNIPHLMENEQKLIQPIGTLTPDCLLQETTLLQWKNTEIMEINWVECKLSFGSLASSKKVLATAEKYVKLFGPGAICFRNGCGDELATQLRARGVVAVDADKVDLDQLKTLQPQVF